MLRELWLEVLTRRERWWAAGLLVLSLIGAFAEALGIGAIFPFLNILNNPAAVNSDGLAGRLFRYSGAQNMNQFVLIGAVTLFVIYFCKNLFLAFVGFLQARFVCGIEARLAAGLLSSYLHMPYVARSGRNSADSIRIINVEVGRATAGFMMPLLTIITDGLVVLGIVALMILVQPVIAGAALMLIGTLGYVVQGVFKRRITDYRDLRDQSSTRMFRRVSEGLGAFKETKVLGREDFFVGEFTADAKAYARATQAFTTFNLLPRPVIETVAVGALLGSVSFVIVAGQPVQEVVPVLILFGLATVRIMPSATRLLGSINNLRFYRPALQAVASDLQLIRAAAADGQNGTASTASRREPLESLELRQVCFQYPGSTGAVVDGLTLRIKNGEMIAIVGESGSGKTTLGDLLLGLLDPGAGEIYVNGRLLPSLKRAWHNMASLVPQNFYLLDDTVRRNVAFGIPDRLIDEARVWHALELARLAGRIRAMPRQLDTPVGDQGAMLSGGERQRLSIARALYDDPDLLVLDEATSALDPATEAEVMETLRGLAGEKTLIIITHRLGAIHDFDRILLMADGRISAEGSYAELMATVPAFRTLVKPVPLPA